MNIGEKKALKHRLKLKLLMLNKMVNKVEKLYENINPYKNTSLLYPINMEKEIKKIKCLCDSMLMLNENDILLVKKREYK